MGSDLTEPIIRPAVARRAYARSGPGRACIGNDETQVLIDEDVFEDPPRKEFNSSERQGVGARLTALSLRHTTAQGCKGDPMNAATYPARGARRRESTSWTGGGARGPICTARCAGCGAGWLDFAAGWLGHCRSSSAEMNGSAGRGFLRHEPGTPSDSRSGTATSKNLSESPQVCRRLHCWEDEAMSEFTSPARPSPSRSSR